METNSFDGKLLINLKLSPFLINKKIRIYNLIEMSGDRGMSYDEISKITEIKVPTVVARINELMYKHQLIKVGRIVNHKNYYVVRKKNDPPNIRKQGTFDKLYEYISECEKNGIQSITISELKKILSK